MSKEINMSRPEVFRKKQQVIWIGLGIFLVMSCFCFAMYSTADTSNGLFYPTGMKGHGLARLGLMIFVIPLFFFWVGIRKILNGLLHRLTFYDGEVLVQGIIKVRRFRFDEVTSLDRGRSGTPLVVQVRGKTLKFHEYEYSPEDFNKICELFRLGVPQDVQNC